MTAKFPAASCAPQISGGIATVTNGIVWTLKESSKALGAGISKSADFLMDSGIIRSSPYESRVNPGVKQTLEVVSQVRSCHEALPRLSQGYG